MILSIDIGIRHLAHCLLKVNDNQEPVVVEWGVVDLTGHKPKQCSVCSKKATYETSTQAFCGVHIKKMKIQVLPKNATTAQLQELCRSINIAFSPQTSRAALLCKLEHCTATECVKPAAAKLDVVALGTGLMREYAVFDKHNITTVVVENQIGPLANRMKSLQGMVVQYWIMKGVRDIHCVSSANKLKLFHTGKTTYKERKRMSIEHARRCMLDEAFKGVFEAHSKKDDLADTFLQGLWYLNSLNLLNADYLKLIVLTKQ